MTMIWLALICHTLPILLNRLSLDSKVIPAGMFPRASAVHPITTYIMTTDLLGKREYLFDYCEIYANLIE